jgi:hypothetical protein
VDGFYAGIVDDFNGVFQSLPLTPGGHTVVLYVEGGVSDGTAQLQSEPRVELQIAGDDGAAAGG